MAIPILITSAGTASAVSVIKALHLQKELPVRLIATDMDPLAPGLHLADAYEVIPSANSTEYMPRMLEIVKREKIQVVIPIFSKEIEVVAAKREAFEGLGVRLMLHPLESIRICNDKRIKAERVAALGIPTPRCFSRAEVEALTEADLPIFVKPVSSSSSKGARPLHKGAEVEMLMPHFEEHIFQPFLQGGTEYTVDILVGPGGKPLVLAPRERIATKAGQAVKGKTVDPEPFREAVGKICEALQLYGPCNMQFMKVGDTYHFIETNPRFAAGGLMLTVGAGANVPLILLKHLLGHPITAAECQTRPGVFMTRYWEEIILENID
jgi:carbamoyl-phosphate synthase large subunit